MPATYILTRDRTRALTAPLGVWSTVVVDVDGGATTLLRFAFLALATSDLEVEVRDERDRNDREADPEHRVLGRQVERVDDHQRRSDAENHPQQVTALHAPGPVSQGESDQKGDCPSHGCLRLS